MDYRADLQLTIMRKKDIIKITVHDGEFKVHINGLLHLNLVQEQIVAIQSWKNFGRYYIEYYLSSGATVLTEYIMLNWVEMLGLLDKYKLVS